MKMKNLIGLVSMAALTAIGTGCGSSSATSTTPALTSGVVIDDYISGAEVCVDQNSDGKVQSTDVPCVITNEVGQFKFEVTLPSDKPLIMSGGTDVGSGNAFEGTLSAPAGSTVVNPLTTLVQSIVTASGNNTNAADAETIVKATLGLDAGIPLTTYDPLATLSTGTTAEKEIAQKVFAQQSAMQVILTAVAKTIAGAVDGLDEKEVTAAAATQMANLMRATPTAVVDIAASASTIITNVANVVVTDATDKANVAAVVATVAAQVEAAADLVVTNIEAIDHTDANALVSVRTEAVQVAEVVATNTDVLVTGLSATVVDTAAINTATTQSTTVLATTVNAIVVSTNLAVVADPTNNTADATVLTGSTGGSQ